MNEMNNVVPADLLVIPSISNSSILDEWLNLLLESTAKSSDKPMIILSFYDPTKLYRAIQTLEQNGIFAGFYQVDTDNSSDMFTQVFKYMRDWKQKGLAIDRIISTLMPCQGDRNELTTKIQQNLDPWFSGTYNEEDPYNHMATGGLFMMLSMGYTMNSALEWHQLMNDPAEVRVNDLIAGWNDNITVHFIHDLPDEQNVAVNPFIIYPFRKKLAELYADGGETFKKMHESKTKDFVFGMTAFDDQRKDIVQVMNQLQPANPEAFKFYYYLKTAQETVDTRIPYNEYLEEVNNSVSTLVIPAYVDTTFSIHRFIESICNGCIPIIYRANWEIAFHDKELCHIIKNWLLLDDIANIESKVRFIDQNYVSIMCQIMQTPYIQHLLQESTYIKNLSNFEKHTID